MCRAVRKLIFLSFGANCGDSEVYWEIYKSTVILLLCGISAHEKFDRVKRFKGKAVSTSQVVRLKAVMTGKSHLLVN